MVIGTHLVEPYQVAEVFANHFKSVYDNTASKFPSNPITYFDVVSSVNLLHKLLIILPSVQT